jgi:hypothetical protein
VIAWTLVAAIGVQLVLVIFVATRLIDAKITDPARPPRFDRPRAGTAPLLSTPPSLDAVIESLLFLLTPKHQRGPRRLNVRPPGHRR